MNRETLRDRLVDDRKPRGLAQALAAAETAPGKSRHGNGVEAALPATAGGAWGIVGGKKLKEAASYLDSARKALLAWTRETCIHSENLETHADHLQEVLATCATLQRMKTTIEFKTTLYGENT